MKNPYPVNDNLVGVELRKSYPSYKSNFGNRSYEIKNKGAKDNQIPCLKRFRKKAKLDHQHPETLEWIVKFGNPENSCRSCHPLCFFGNKEDAIAFIDFHNANHC